MANINGVNRQAIQYNNSSVTENLLNTKSNVNNEKSKSSQKIASTSFRDDLDNVDTTNSATRRGTRVVKKGNELDKNAFLRILTAELTNQDPMNTKDSTAYVSQLAQFSSLEQMANLNNTMSFNSASGLIGKTVALDQYDDWGHQYGGTVENVTKRGDSIILSVNVPKYKGDKIVGLECKDFQYKSLSDVLNVIEDNTVLLSYLKDNFAYLNNNMNFMSASGLINKNVELTTFETGEDGKTIEDSKEIKYLGNVKEVYKTKEGIKIKVKLNETGEEKEFSFDDISKIIN